MDYQNRFGEYQIWLPNTVVSKLRPRFNFLDEEERKRRADKKGIPLEQQKDKVVYLDARYRDWKEQAVGNIESTIKDKNIFGQDWNIASSRGENFFPAKPLDIQVDIFGKHRGDKDNQFASIVDALVSAKVIGGIDKNGKEHYADAPSFMPSGAYRTWKSTHQKGALITLTQLPKNNPYFEEADLITSFKEVDDETLIIWIPEKCFSKLRPRGGSNGWVGNNSEYVAWKNKHSSSIRYKLKFPNINEFHIKRLFLSNKLTMPVNETLRVSASFVGKGHGGDCDNRMGAVLDLLVDSKIIKNDGVNCIPHGNFKCYQSKSLFGTLVKIQKQPVVSGDNFFLETTTSGFFTSQDLISQGWTKGLITKFLADPDEVRDNPVKANKALELFYQDRVNLVINNHDLQIKLVNNLSKRKK